MRTYVLFEECLVEIQISVFQIRTLFTTVNYLADYVFVNCYAPHLKFKRVIFKFLTLYIIDNKSVIMGL